MEERMPANRLIVLDDEPAIGSLVANVAGRIGYAAEAVASFTDFKNALARDDPTHVVLDLQMPDADGVEVLAYLADLGSRARLILMSGVDARVLEVAGQVAQDNGLDVIATCVKPVRAAELRDLLSTHAYPEKAEIDSDALAMAVAREEIHLHFQPKLRLSDRRIVGFEALARWRHAAHGQVPPDIFIPLAERSGLISEVTQRVFGQAARTVRSLDALDPALGVSVNISSIDLQDGHLADRLAATCRDEGVKPDRITLELTETAAMSDPSRAKAGLVRLRLKGFKLSVDDFGIGYSSLALLRQMPFSELKIDRSFVRDCTTSRDSSAIVGAVTAMAHALELSVVAEGVEDADILTHLVEAGVDEAQGYWISRPVEVENIADLVSK
ncbi:EAL domain-containing protein [Marinibaculum pumilum]|uniref:EAL domain-containing protein n=1 Tax=Marinibaculum pumilum TaxID=1766165 RepID=A0ABV7L0M7_9PROT